MKVKIIIASAIALMFGLSNAVYAKPSSYYPPERMNCQVNMDGKLVCFEFDREFLVEDPVVGDFQTNRDDVFYFVTAASYTTTNHKETTIFFTYNNSEHQVIKLRSIKPNIKPDLKNGNWKKFNEDIYTCDTGYMNCPITNLR